MDRFAARPITRVVERLPLKKLSSTQAFLLVVAILGLVCAIIAIVVRVSAYQAAVVVLFCFLLFAVSRPYCKEK